MSSFHDRSNPGPRPVESQRLVMMTCPTGHRWVYLDGFSKKTCDTCNQPPSHRELYGHVLSPHEIERVCDLLEQNELDRLQRWQREALLVMADWDDAYQRSGVQAFGVTKAAALLDEIERLRADLAAAYCRMDDMEGLNDD